MKGADVMLVMFVLLMCMCKPECLPIGDYIFPSVVMGTCSTNDRPPVLRGSRVYTAVILLTDIKPTKLSPCQRMTLCPPTPPKAAFMCWMICSPSLNPVWSPDYLLKMLPHVW